MINNEGMFLAGKYAGDTVGAVARTEAQYIYWALGAADQLALTARQIDVLKGALAPEMVVPPLPAAPPLPVIPPLPASVPVIPPLPPIPPLPRLEADEPALEGTVEDTTAIVHVSNDGHIFSNGLSKVHTADDLNEMMEIYVAPPPSRPKIEWTREQLGALDQIDSWLDGGGPKFYALTGPAGTGKTTVIEEIVDRYPHATLTAMTGKAALRLEECAGRAASTLHKVLYFPPKPGEDVRFTRLREPPSSLIVVDESSMVSPGILEHLKQWAEHYDTKFLLVGDSYQLPPVITGEEMRKHGSEDYSVFSIVGGTALQTVMRNAGGVLQAATHVRETGSICEESIPDATGGYEYAREQRPIERAIEEYLADPDDHMLITWKNASRMSANKMIRQMLGHEGPLPDEGEPVLFKKNGQDRLNGEIVPAGEFTAGPTIADMRTLWMTIKGDPTGQKILVSVDGGDKEKGGEWFDGGLPWVADFRKFHAQLKVGGYPEPLPITFGYCLTAHSAQGSQARRVTVFLDREDLRNKHFRKATTLPTGKQAPFSSRFIYTATTRSRLRTTMIVGR